MNKFPNSSTYIPVLFWIFDLRWLLLPLFWCLAWESNQIWSLYCLYANRLTSENNIWLILGRHCSSLSLFSIRSHHPIIRLSVTVLLWLGFLSLNFWCLCRSFSKTFQPKVKLIFAWTLLIGTSDMLLETRGKPPVKFLHYTWIICLQAQLLPPAYVVRREGNVLTCVCPSVCPQGGTHIP